MEKKHIKLYIYRKKLGYKTLFILQKLDFKTTDTISILEAARYFTDVKGDVLRKELNLEKVSYWSRRWDHDELGSFRTCNLVLTNKEGELYKVREVLSLSDLSRILFGGNEKNHTYEECMIRSIMKNGMNMFASHYHLDKLNDVEFEIADYPKIGELDWLCGSIPRVQGGYDNRW